MEASERQNSVFDVFTEARHQKALHQYADDAPLDGKHIRLAGRDLLSFGSCSYLGLETDERLKEGVRRAVDRYGTQFSSSRAYVSGPPYSELEECLAQILEGHVFTTASTTLGHFSAIPVICHEKDIILLDQMVHHSVHMAVTQARAQGTAVKLVRHNDWQSLEEQLELLTPTYRKVWFMLDGVYSMFGDMPDVKELRRLLDKYPTLNLYVDDAHGMSIAGKHGRGMHLSRMGWHPRMVVAISLNKAFASAGGCIVFQDHDMRERVRLCGGPYTFGGPIQPPMLGAALASAQLHLSDEITGMQNELLTKVQYFNAQLLAHGVPIYEQNHTPIFFVKCGPLRAMHALLRRLNEEGYWIAAGIYPGVPLRHNGARISITRHHTVEDLSGLAQAIGFHHPKALEEVGMTQEQVESLFAYKHRVAERQRRARLARVYEVAEVSEVPPADAEKTPSVVQAVSGLKVEYVKSIAQFDPTEWNTVLGHRSSLNYNTLRSLEQTFQNQPKPENNWGWHYLIVRDGPKPVAATFFTDTLWKDDMMMRAEVSDRVEALRANDPYLLTSRSLTMGSALTEGNHLFLDRAGPWQQALELLLEEAGRIQTTVGASGVIVRDLPDNDPEFDALMVTVGFVKMPILASHSIDLTTFTNEKEFLTTLGNRTRRRVRAEVIDVQAHFSTKLWRHGVDPAPSAQMFENFYNLYRKVKVRKHRLNTFDLPTNIFECLWATPGWELMTLHLSPDAQGPASGEPIAVTASCLNGKTFVGVIAGLDSVERELSVYRQLLWRVILRAKELGATTLELGMDAEREKLRLGAVARTQCVYAQLVDHSSSEILEQVIQEVSLGNSTNRGAAAHG